MLLDRKSKKMLKAIKKLNKQGIDSPHNDDLQKILPYDSETLVEIAEFLQDYEYVSYFNADCVVYEISLTYKGKNYNEFNRIAFKEFLFKSIFVPIGVSFLTTVLISFL